MKTLPFKAQILFLIYRASNNTNISLLTLHCIMYKDYIDGSYAIEIGQSEVKADFQFFTVCFV
jgi:hypothetical protein